MRWLFGGNKPATGEVDQDFSGTKVYDVNGLKAGTRGQILDQVGEIASQWLSQNDPLGGAQRLLDMFTLVPNRELLKKSREMQYVAFGDGETKGTIQFLLEDAVRRAEAQGSVDVPTRTKYERLHARYVDMVKSVTGVEPVLVEQTDKRPFPRIWREPEDGSRDGATR